MANPFAYRPIGPAVGATVKQQIVAALFKATFHRLFTRSGTFKRQPGAELFIEIR